MDPIVEAAQAQLKPLFEALLERFKDDGALYEMSFFAVQYDALNRATDDVSIAELFMQLSSVAFLGFQFTPQQAVMVDELLAKAEQMAHALSADDDQAH
ncbi:MAG: hypothetical protein AAF648_01855 [Pseudomonadota bacterium]